MIVLVSMYIYICIGGTKEEAREVGTYKIGNLFEVLTKFLMVGVGG